MKSPLCSDICIPTFSFIHNSQDMETTSVSINRRMDKEIVCVCVCVCVNKTYGHTDLIFHMSVYIMEYDKP
jgi:hypothetical protein